MMDGSANPETPKAKLTPMMAQYLEVKQQAGDALLFYRMGDFYELFFDDAVKAASTLDITLTRRGQHKGEDIPMCGVPHHSHEAYLARLIKAGHKVAICEQTETPEQAKKRGSKSVVRREIVRLVTPGTLTEDNLLDASESSYLLALSLLQGSELSLAWVDVSTGEVFTRKSTLSSLLSDLAALMPREVLCADKLYESHDFTALRAELEQQFTLTLQDSSIFSSSRAAENLCELYRVKSLDAFGAFSASDLSALGALSQYILLTQVGKVPALRPPQQADINDTLIIDRVTRSSLELHQTQDGQKQGTLLHAMDRSQTGPGKRLLAQWLMSPLCEKNKIIERQDAVEFFLNSPAKRERVKSCLAQAPDLSRALSRLSLERGGPRDLQSVQRSVSAAIEMKRILVTEHDDNLTPLPALLHMAFSAVEGESLEKLHTLSGTLVSALSDELPLLARDGGFIRSGFDEELDEVRVLRNNSRQIIVELETEYRQQTSIKSLKIKHNNVLGYFIDVPAGQAKPLMEAPLSETYIHRQTLANNMRFTTVKLSELASKIVQSRDKALALEMALYDELVAHVLALGSLLSSCAAALALVDVVQGLALLAEEKRYVRPSIGEGTEFFIKGGRHPVVENSLRQQGEGEQFIPNDCTLSKDDKPLLWLVTGPNMAGKSTFLRQNALIVIMAQMGSFVPAEEAKIGLVDRVFSRVGASDDLARGRSTFMVEMVETAAILNQATDKSLVVLDEIGRGTSTYDGLSIAWASLEQLHDINKCRGLFATHYHELTKLAERLPRARNSSMRVREWEDEVIFLHEVTEGPADRSYGVAVAKLAGLPPAVVSRAKDILALLEDGQMEGVPQLTEIAEELPLFKAAPAVETQKQTSLLREKLLRLHPDELSPREALDLIYSLRKLAADE